MSYVQPPVGTVRNSRGQAYTFLGIDRVHRTKDGRDVTVWAWETACADCDEPVTAWAVGDRPTYYARRRCEPCAAGYAKPSHPTAAERREHQRRRNAAKQARHRARRLAARSTRPTTEEKE